MHVGIDASNLRGGGGVTHLIELLRHARADDHGFSRITVWCGRQTADRLKDLDAAITLECPDALNRSLPHRLKWVKRSLPQLATGVDVLFAPGGLVGEHKVPTVTMSRNMLPFEKRERQRFSWGWQRLRLELLARQQAASFKRATGLIFVSQYAKETVSKVAGLKRDNVTVIAHGVNEMFRRDADEYTTQQQYTIADPFKLVYVSTINRYKHQNTVATAVGRMRAGGIPVTLDMYGGSEAKALSQLRSVIRKYDPDQEFLRYQGSAAYEDLPGIYHGADAFVYASSCENLPNILIEAMASALPVCSSEYGPMPEVLGDAGLYFDPEQAGSIEQALATMYHSREKRRAFSVAASDRARVYSWQTCTDQTFAFIRKIHAQNATNR